MIKENGGKVVFCLPDVQRDEVDDNGVCQSIKKLNRKPFFTVEIFRHVGDIIIQNIS